MTKKGLKIFLILLLVIIVAATIFLVVPYGTEEIATDMLDNENVSEANGIIQIKGEKKRSAIIFYPGAKVNSVAYLPLFERVVEETGVSCYLVDMPFNLAVFKEDAAKEIIEDNEEIENWYMAGHSLGGSMASSFASDNQELISGIILLASYVYGDYPTEQSLTVYGTFNSNIGSRVNYTDNIVIIEGGNHAQFGNYGKQLGDPDATITAEEQQRVTAEAIRDFLDDME